MSGRWLIVFLFGANLARAAACCGGGAGTAFVITGEEFTRWRVVQGRESNFGKSLEYGRLALASHSAHSYRGSLQLAQRLGGRWQGGGELAWVETPSGSTRLADFHVGVSYAVWRNYLYSVWRPEVFVIGGMTLPTGTSFYQNRQLVTGDQLYKVRLGLLFHRQNIGSDWSLAVHGEKALQEGRFASAKFRQGALMQVQAQIGHTPRWAPDWHVSLGAEFGYRLANQVQATGAEPQSSLPAWSFPCQFSFAYAWSERLAMALNYRSSRWFPSQNTSLVDGLSLQFSYRKMPF